MSDGIWHWWASRDGEVYTVGPCATREEAIQEAKNNEVGHFDDYDNPTTLTFVLLEAYKLPVDLAGMVDIEYMIERFEDCNDELLNEDGESPLADVPSEKWRELEIMLKATVKGWQEARNVKPVTWRFTKTRNEETVTVALDG